MKLSSKVLAGSLASAGMVLSLVAPALTAQAATTSGTVGTDGKVTHVANGTDAGPLGEKDSKLAIAYSGLDTDGTTEVKDGEATAKSNANVTVQSGILTLDAVPDFGFGNAAPNSTVALNSNDYDVKEEDSQGKGKLTVTESRENQPGFVLSAAITAFTDKADKTNTQNYTLNLKPTKLLNDEGANVSKTGVASTNDISIAGAADTNTGADVKGDVMSLAAGTYNAGPINASYTADDDDAFLNLSADKNSGSSNSSVKSYNATITWTLSAQAPTAA